MTCAEFQKVLPYMIESGANSEQEDHLRGCLVCSDLVADLKYIAEQAKLLLPMYDPHPRVWDGIEASLKREGLVKPARARGRLLGFPIAGAAPWIAAAVGVLLMFLGVAVYQRNTSAGRNGSSLSVANSTAGASTTATTASPEDEAILKQVAAHRPALKNTYEDNLRRVNAYISDAKRNLEQNPDDDQARQHLIDAYEQKTLIYDMAVSRSLQ